MIHLRPSPASRRVQPLRRRSPRRPQVVRPALDGRVWVLMAAALLLGFTLGYLGAAAPRPGAVASAQRLRMIAASLATGWVSRWHPLAPLPLARLLIGLLVLGSVLLLSAVLRARTRRSPRRRAWGGEPPLAWRRVYFWSPQGAITAQSIGQFLDANPAFRERLPWPALRAVASLQARVDLCTWQSGEQQRRSRSRGGAFS